MSRKYRTWMLIAACFLVEFLLCRAHNDSKFPVNNNKIDDFESTAHEQPAEEKKPKPKEYGEGSICVYCKYCKLCRLCNTDCPCEKDSTSSHCKLCKYCPYCKYCESACENFCQPGGFLDEISSAIHTALPKINAETVKQIKEDIDAAREWLNQYF